MLTLAMCPSVSTPGGVVSCNLCVLKACARCTDICATTRQTLLDVFSELIEYFVSGMVSLITGTGAFIDS